VNLVVTVRSRRTCGLLTHRRLRIRPTVGGGLWRVIDSRSSMTDGVVRFAANQGTRLIDAAAPEDPLSCED